MSTRIRPNCNINIDSESNTYEFYVKIYTPVDAPNLTQDGWDIEVDLAVQIFTDKLKKRYKWVSDVYLTGRSGGWLAIEATRPIRESVLWTVMELVDKEKKKFIKYLEKEFK